MSYSHRTSNKLRIDQGAYDNQTQSYNQSMMKSNSSHDPISGSIIPTTLDWEVYHTLFISEAAFAIGTVLTFLALLRDAVILSFVGPLLVSFVGMIADIARFLLIFVFVWISFGIGMTLLYQALGRLEEAMCILRDRPTDCQPTPFAS